MKIGLFDRIRRAIIRETAKSIDISNALPIATTGKRTPYVQQYKRTVIQDVLENPEHFILEAWLEKDEINVRVKRRFDIEAESHIVDVPSKNK